VNNHNYIHVFIALVAVLAAMAWASNGDYEHEIQQQQHYKEMVCSGLWPNYKKQEIDCD